MAPRLRTRGDAFGPRLCAHRSERPARENAARRASTERSRRSGERRSRACWNDEHPTIVVGIGGNVAGVLAHEMTHVAMLFGRRGLGGNLSAVPVWFAEGVAASIGGEPSCPENGANAETYDVRALRTPRQWFDFTNANGPGAYCDARAEAEAWVIRVGKKRFFALLDGVREGGSFDELYDAPK